MTNPSARIHPTAIVEDGVVLGDGTSVWDNAHVRGPGTVIGEQCIIGGKAYVAYGVRIGHRCKLNSFVYVCNGVALGDGVMLAAGVTFTNDRYPRATTPDLRELLASEPDDHTLDTLVGDGVTVGARAVIGPGLHLGNFSMIGMGGVVTRDVPAFHLVAGNPAITIGAVSRAGALLARASGGRLPNCDVICERSGASYRIEEQRVFEMT
jgi:acetyltransferase-like isoleucine patch superfamily enzyme